MRLLIAALAAFLLAAAPARAADYFVAANGGDDPSGSCSGDQCTPLRAALAAASDTPPSTVHVPAGPIALTAVLEPADGTTIAGAGADQTTISGPGNDRVFNVNGETTVGFSGLTMSGGREPDSSGGGTLRIGPSAIVVLDHVRVTGGHASVGAGIFSDVAQTLTISHSLIDGNVATGPGGGIESQGSDIPTSLAITDTTITGNSAATGGGLDLNSPTSSSTNTLQRVTLARNTAQSGSNLNVADPRGVQVGGSIIALGAGSDDCAGALEPVSTGGNLESGSSCGFALHDLDPQLGALTAAGGETPTLPLAATSPAVDAGGTCGPATDQRDVARPQGLACDAGAYELIPAAAPPPPPPPTVTPTPTAAPVPAPTPIPGKTVVAEPVSGNVRVKLPGAKDFVDVDATQGIPLGSTVDTRDGRVTINPKPGSTADFYDGLFKLTQSKGVTILTLTEQLATCPRKKTASAAAKKPKTRKLWGSGSGSFSTRGQYSAATVRGTVWEVQDSCSGTLTKVTKGVVSVHDTVRNKTILLRAHKHYLARPRR
jgi:hypothetical protein